jgi:type II secretory pathway component PulF
VLHAAYGAGRLEAGLRLLANECSAKAGRWRRFKHRLGLPFFLLVAASLLGPLPGLIAGTVSTLGFVFRAIAPPGLLIGAILVVRGLMERRDAAGAVVGRAVLEIPVIGRLIDLRAKRDYVVVLAMALRSGIPAFEALPLARSAVSSRAVAESFSAAEDLVRSGQSVAGALQRSGVFDSPAGYAFATTGEFAGDIDGALERYGRVLDEQAASYADQASEWTPRILYLTIAGWIAVQVIGFWTSYFPIAGGSQ